MQSPMMKNITRYTYMSASFQGWRVCICRNGKRFTRYISDKMFDSEEHSFSVAKALRDNILDELQASPQEAEAIFERYSSSPLL